MKSEGVEVLLNPVRVTDTTWELFQELRIDLTEKCIKAHAPS